MLNIITYIAKDCTKSRNPAYFHCGPFGMEYLQDS